MNPSASIAVFKQVRELEQDAATFITDIRLDSCFRDGTNTAYLGQHPANDIVLQTQVASSMLNNFHCVIKRALENCTYAYIIKDNNSLKGSWLLRRGEHEEHSEWVKVDTENGVKLKSGDIVTFGAVDRIDKADNICSNPFRFRFMLTDAPPSETLTSSLQENTHDEEITNTMECCICREDMVDAHVLNPCGHSFCGLCAFRWWKRGKRCAKCRSPTKDFPVPNYQLNSLLDVTAFKVMDTTDLEKRKKRKAAFIEERENFKKNVVDSEQNIRRSLIRTHARLYANPESRRNEPNIDGVENFFTQVVTQVDPLNLPDIANTLGNFFNAVRRDNNNISDSS
eukprot:gene361-677_t